MAIGGGAGLCDRLLVRCRFPGADAAPAYAAPADGAPADGAPAEGSAVTLAVSGGADSLALLVLAVRAGLDVVAVHVDHGLRAGSAAEAMVVADAAARYGARFEARSVTVGAGPDLEARARRARYQVLPADVLTGHTMDDQAETILLAMMWGAALDGLAGMRPDRAGWVRRPLLGLRRHETVALCAAEGLVPIVDPTNRDPRFRRNRVRAEVLPLLSEVAGRDLVPVLARQAELLAADADLLEKISAGINPTDTRALRAAPPPLARRAIRRWLRSPAGFADVEGHPPSADEVARVLAVAGGVVRACELPGGRRIERHAGRLTVAGR